MPIRVTCQCGRQYHLGDDCAGQTHRCHVCGAEFHVPDLPPGASDRRHRCDQCGGLFSVNEVVDDDGRVLCHDCYQTTHELHLRTRGRRAGPSFFAVLGLLALVAIAGACAVLWQRIHQERRAAQRIDARRQRQARRDKQAKPEPLTWAFQAPVPRGFEFWGKKERGDHTFWILRGAPYGHARETLVVVQSTPDRIETAPYRAWYWAMELCLNVSPGTSRPGAQFRRQLAKTKAVHCTTLTLREFPNQKVLIPRADAGGTQTLALAPTAFSLAADFTPGPLSACSARVHGALAVVAWAGEAGRADDRARVVAQLSRDLRADVGRGLGAASDPRP